MSQSLDSEDRFFITGQAMYAASILLFGVQYLLYGHFSGGLFPAQDWTPSLPILAYLFGLVLIAASIALFVPNLAQRAALTLGIIVCAGVVVVNYTHIAAVVAHGVERTRAFEPLALGSAALVLAGVMTGSRSRARALDVTGRSLFGFSMCVFGVQHFLYTAYIATLIPSWVPAHVALVYTSGFGFIASGVAIITGIQARLGAMLLGVMMLLFILLVQVPPLVAKPSNGDLWTSLYVPLALCGSAWIIASTRNVLKERQAAQEILDSKGGST